MTTAGVILAITIISGYAIYIGTVIKDKNHKRR